MARSVPRRMVGVAARNPMLVLLAGLAVALGAWMADLKMNQGPGTSLSLPRPDASQTTRPKAGSLSRPLKIEVDGATYRVGSRTVSLAEIEALIDRVPAGDGPDVSVNRLENSRARAEEELKKLFRRSNARAVWYPTLE
jgi:hypothetical protein